MSSDEAASRSSDHARMEPVWTTPELTEVNMSSEIGGYQDEFEPERDPRFVELGEDAEE